MAHRNFVDFGYGFPSTSNFNTNLIEQNNKRKRTKFNDIQLQQLEQSFRRCQYPQGHDREQLANRLGLTETKVQVWFKNRRAKQRDNDKYEKLKQESIMAQAKAENKKNEALLIPTKFFNNNIIKDENVGETEEENEESTTKNLKKIKKETLKNNFFTNSMPNVPSINMAAAAMLEPNFPFFQPSAATMAAAVVATSSLQNTNYWNLPNYNPCSQSTPQNFQFPLAQSNLMSNYSSSTMVNMNMIAPNNYGLNTPISNTNIPNLPSTTTNSNTTNVANFYPTMPSTYYF